MRRIVLLLLGCTLAASVAYAARPHLINFGKTMTVKFFVGPDEKNTVDMRIRPLYVDGRLKEFTTGEPYDVTDRLFVVRQVIRLNDRLPEDAKKGPNFLWQRGTWLMVNRDTGRVAELKLPEFDPFYSAASWYRDYVAYCGLSSDGEKLYAVVFQIATKSKKPLIRQRLGDPRQGDSPESVCLAPTWDRQPPRVTFAPTGGQKVTFTIRGTVTELGEAAGSADPSK